MATLFKGFSTVDKVRAPYTLTDADLVKRDLLNHFYTRIGERIMRPTFGSVIWDYLMEPEDPRTQEIIKDDIERIVNSDPRVEHQDTTLLILDHTIQAEVKIKYKLLNSEDSLFLEYVTNSTDNA
ncbi:GPW/gp25 family protein [bacterium]|jgi:phage baseplate assembly protein W|nr:GPW/gp25 family protein [bacterium]|tara:strand:+ start:524 stop:898 length:375 start_codon:yes stop_codon:yes gene_type:complete